MPTERPLSPWHLPPEHPAQLFLTGPTPLFALTGDPRVSYCLYVPRGHSNTGEPPHHPPGHPDPMVAGHR